MTNTRLPVALPSSFNSKTLQTANEPPEMEDPPRGPSPNRNPNDSHRGKGIPPNRDWRLTVPLRSSDSESGRLNFHPAETLEFIESRPS
ncbi:hypothetical protein Bca4012_020882 [Brassica carinata]|uniref:Uncharacterized protein n=1 Tax=Brassica carinata TaxID=52824 RepID=A0A8X7WIQ1_BRACI|nr:hypothetical protein Bca52824_000745 [Brassica carinata]